MARTKQVPLPNVSTIKLKEFFKDAVKSTPQSPGEIDNGPVSKTFKKSSKSLRVSQKRSVEGTSLRKSVIASRKGKSEDPFKKETSEGTSGKGTSESTSRKGFSGSTYKKDTSEGTSGKGTSESTSRKGFSGSTYKKDTSEGTSGRGKSESTSRKGNSESTSQKDMSEGTSRKGTSESTSRKGTSESTSQKEMSEGTSGKGTSESTSRKGSSESTSRKSTSNKSSSRKETTPRKRLKNGAGALREIRRLQKSTNLLIPLAAFIRVVRDTLVVVEEKRRKMEPDLPNGYLLDGLRFSADAIACLHEATEIQLTNFFTMSYYCTLHARRKTLMVRDCQLARLFLGRNHPLNP